LLWTEAFVFIMPLYSTFYDLGKVLIKSLAFHRVDPLT
jgi:hypothetical protein